jgi:hypothetical protein
MSAKPFFPLIVVWLACMLLVVRCAVGIGLELAYPDPSYLFLGLQMFVAAIATAAAYTFAVLIDTRDRERGSASITLMVLLSLASLVLLSPGCAWLKGEGKAASKTVVDCTAQQAKKLTTELSPTFEQLLTRATGGDGRVDWPSIEDATRNLTEIGWCALENTVAHLLSQIPQAGSPQSSPVPMGYDELMHGMAVLRHKKFEGKTFKMK